MASPQDQDLQKEVPNGLSTRTQTLSWG